MNKLYKVKSGIAFLIFFGIMSCEKKTDFTKIKIADENIVVQYKRHFLTDRDIKLILPKDVSKEDSAKLVEAYIEEWVKKKAIVDKAEENIDDLTLKEIENKITEYRQDLLINAYNNHLIERSLKDSIQESEILAYFEENKKSFPLNKDIVNYRAISVYKSDESRAEKLFNSGKDEDFLEAVKISEASRLQHQDQDSSWYSVESLVSQYPKLNESNLLSQLLNRRRLKFSSDSIVTMIRILKLKPKGSEAPYEFVKPTIKNLLVNKRKLNLLGNLQNELYKEAINRNEIKIDEN
ncbi:MAG: hypothetical protein WDA08_09760 [Weeksellaceae bacterium]